MEFQELDWQGGGRNAMEKAAMVAIFDALTYIAMDEPVNVENLVESLFDLPYSECDPFVKGCLIATISHYGEAILAFNSKMRKWTFDRLNRLEQAILLLAYVHYFYVEPNDDKSVVIDVAIKQAKTYLDEKDYKFVNAILDNVLKKED